MMNVGERMLRHYAVILGRRREHRTNDERKHAVTSAANAVTVLRVMVAAGVLILAAHNDSRMLLVLGLSVSWVGDMLDGHLARTLRCETVLGAQLDGLADRVSALGVVVASAVIAAGSTLSVVAAAVVWLQFGVLDHALSAQFLRYDLWSPDEFHLKDEHAWRLNWAPLAKMASNLSIGLLAVGGPLLWGAIAVAAALSATRAPSGARLLAGAAPRPRAFRPVSGLLRVDGWELGETSVGSDDSAELEQDGDRVPAAVSRRA